MNNLLTTSQLHTSNPHSSNYIKIRKSPVSLLISFSNSLNLMTLLLNLIHLTKISPAIYFSIYSPPKKYEICDIHSSHKRDCGGSDGNKSNTTTNHYSIFIYWAHRMNNKPGCYLKAEGLHYIFRHLLHINYPTIHVDKIFKHVLHKTLKEVIIM